MNASEGWSRHRGIQRTPKWMLAGSLIPPMVIITAVYMQPYVHPAWLLRDPAAVAASHGLPDHTPIYYGAVSNLGVLVWSIAAWVCLFVGMWLVTEVADHANGQFMLASGLFTTILLVDDFFMVHELVFPFLTGLDEKLIIFFYGFLLIIYLYTFRGIILKQRVLLLLIALSAFGASAAIDLVGKLPFAKGLSSTSIEDSAKLIGIFAWSVFYLEAAWNLLTIPLRAAAKQGNAP